MTRSWRRVLWSLAAVVLLAAAIVSLSLPRAGDAPANEPVAATSPIGAPIEPAPSSTVETDAPLASAGGSGNELVEVCGIGWVEPDASGAWDTAAAKGVPDVLASQRALLDAIRADGEPGAAIATVLELHGAAREDGAGTAASALLCAGPDCAASAPGRQLATGLLEQLARHAAASSDGRVYALAMKACEPVPTQGSCALLSVEQWARLDDGNGLPWLHMLERARRGNDAARAQEALYRIGAAARFEERLFVAAGSVADHAGAADVDLIAAELLAVDTLLQSGRVAPFDAIAKTCAGATLADANRRQACDSAAATLAERSDSWIAVGVGAALGARLGWPDDRVDALRGLQLAADAMRHDGEAALAPARALELPSTCGGARRMLALFSSQARAGEVQPIRDWLAANGASIAPFAQRARALVAKRDETSATNAAAEAASAPASAAAVARVDASAPASADVALAPAAAIPYSEAPPPAR